MIKSTAEGAMAKRTTWSVRRMSREAKANLAAAVMISTLYKVTMDSVVDRHPCISEAKLFQLTRRRIQRRPLIWIDEAARYFSMAEA